MSFHAWGNPEGRTVVRNLECGSRPARDDDTLWVERFTTGSSAGASVRGAWRRAGPRRTLKRLVLLIGARTSRWLAASNTVNLVATTSGARWTFLDSTNVAYVESISKNDGTPHWVAVLVVVAATTRRPRNGGRPAADAVFIG